MKSTFPPKTLKSSSSKPISKSLSSQTPSLILSFPWLPHSFKSPSLIPFPLFTDSSSSSSPPEHWIPYSRRGVVSALLTAASGVNNVRVSVRDGKKRIRSLLLTITTVSLAICARYTLRFRDIITNSFGTWPTLPLFGVCMGLQCIGEAFGGQIVRSPYGVMHGKSSQVFYDEKGEDGLFLGLSNPFTAGRYHSLVIENDSFPNEALEVTAWTEDGLVMAARHRKFKHIQGVLFHPESIITTEGKEIVRNFLKLIDRMEAGYIFVHP